jgi:hypothetical protein
MQLDSLPEITDREDYLKYVNEFDIIKSELKHLLDNYQYLKTKLYEDLDSVTDKEVSWYLVYEQKLKNINVFILDNMKDFNQE